MRKLTDKDRRIWAQMRADGRAFDRTLMRDDIRVRREGIAECACCLSGIHPGEQYRTVVFIAEVEQPLSHPFRLIREHTKCP